MRPISGFTVRLASTAGFMAALAGSAYPQVPILQIDSAANGHLGRSLANVGDLDADGIDDFVVGEPERMATNSSGWAYSYSGATGALIHQHPAPGHVHFGDVVAAAGDLDGDVVPDYLVSGPGVSDMGIVVAYSGATGGELWSITGFGPAHEIGAGLASAGDLDGDGRNELLVSRVGRDRVDVYTSAGILLYTVAGQDAGRFGSAVAGSSDLDGDGVPEFAVGEPNWDDKSTSPTRFDVGRVRIYSGATGTLLKASFGASEGAFHGGALARGVDWNGDGIDELIVGSPYGPSSTYAGRVAVLDPKANVELWANVGVTGDYLGFAMTAVPDVDLDGVADVAVGAPGASSGVGRVELFSGSDGASITHVDGDPVESGWFGEALAGGDWNLDGIGDWLVGDPSYLSGPNVVGRVVAFAGCPARVASYGAGWPGTNGIPTLDCTEPPEIGDLGEIRIGSSNQKSLTFGAIFVGFDDADLPTGADGRLLELPAYTLPFVVLGPSIRVWSPIPDVSSLAFLDLYVQAIEADPGASKGLSFTAGLKLTIGFEMR